MKTTLLIHRILLADFISQLNLEFDSGKEKSDLFGELDGVRNLLVTGLTGLSNCGWMSICSVVLGQVFSWVLSGLLVLALG